MDLAPRLQTRRHKHRTETETDSCQCRSWTSRRMHKLSETKERWTSLRHFPRWTDHDSKEQSKNKEQSKSNTQCDISWKLTGRPIWRTTFGAQPEPNDARGRCRESRRFLGTMLCLYTSHSGRFDTLEWSRCSSPGLEPLSCTDKQTRFLSFFVEWYFRVWLANLASKGAICARPEMLKFIHVVNNDTIMHAVHTCTVAFSTQSWSSVVSVLFLIECAHSVIGSRNKIHGIGHTVMWTHQEICISSERKPFLEYSLNTPWSREGGNFTGDLLRVQRICKQLHHLK